MSNRDRTVNPDKQLRRLARKLAREEQRAEQERAAFVAARGRRARR